MIVLALLLALSSAEGLAAAQDRAPEVVVNADWALGQPVAGEWQSVLVELQNTGAKDREVVVEVQEEFSNLRLRRAETVTAGGRRRFHLSLPLGGVGRQILPKGLRVRALDPAGKEIHGSSPPTNTTGWSPGTTVIAVLTRDRAVEGKLRFPPRRGAGTVNVVFPSTRTFPDHWTALEGVRALVLHDAPLAELSPDQARAIRDFAIRGGAVILSPGVQRDAFAHPVVAALAEIRVGEPRRSSAAGGPEFLLHPILNGAEFKAPERGVTDGCRIFECGYGAVLALPFDVALPPLAGSDRLERLWTLALDLGGSAPSVPIDLVDASAALTTLVNPYPSFALLVGLSALYLLAVGPVNYLVLRRLRMTLLLVVTVPVISAAFLGVVLGVGYLLKGSSTLVCSLRVFAAREGAPAAVEAQLATVFSPESRAFRVAFPRDRAPLPLDRINPELRELSELRVDDASPRAFDAVAIGQWQTWRATVKSHADLGRGVRFSTENGSLTVSNESPLPILRGVHVRRIADRAVGTPFGALPPAGRAVRELEARTDDPALALAFPPGSVGAALMERASFSAALGVGPGQELLLCLLADDAPLLEVDSRPAGRERSLAVLTVLKEAP